MARTRASAKKAGTSFETEVCRLLKDRTGLSIIRMPKNGASDRGDIFGAKLHGEDIAIECKSPGENSSWSLAEWWRETVAEKENLNAKSGVLMIKNFRKPIQDSFCVLNVSEAEVFGVELSNLETTRVRGNSKWKELVVGDQVLKFPMVGKDDFWIVMTLGKFVEFLDKKTEGLTVSFSRAQLEELITNKTLQLHTVDGTPITINCM